MASATRVALPDGERTWTVVGDDYSVAGPVEEWLDASRELWSPNTVRAYATVLARWWSFLGQRGERWDAAGVVSFGAFLAWQRTGRRADAVIGTVPPTLSPATLQNRLEAVLSFYRWQEAVHEVPVAARLYKGRPHWRRNVGLLSHLDSRSTAKTTSVVRVRTLCRLRELLGPSRRCGGPGAQPRRFPFREPGPSTFVLPMKETTVRAKVAALKKQGIGPPGWTPHWFRHTHASALLLAGAPDRVVSRRLGHAPVRSRRRNLGSATPRRAYRCTQPSTRQYCLWASAMPVARERSSGCPARPVPRVGRMVRANVDHGVVALGRP